MIKSLLLPIVVEQSASNEVDGSVAPSRANNSHKRKAKATDNACVTRTTRSKASQNGRKPRNTQLYMCQVPRVFIYILN